MYFYLLIADPTDKFCKLGAANTTACKQNVLYFVHVNKIVVLKYLKTVPFYICTLLGFFPRLINVLTL